MITHEQGDMIIGNIYGQLKDILANIIFAKYESDQNQLMNQMLGMVKLPHNTQLMKEIVTITKLEYFTNEYITMQEALKIRDYVQKLCD